MLMLIRDILKTVNAELVYGEEFLCADIHAVCSSDLMSDVLAFVKDQAMLITGLVNPQVIRTAEVMDMRAVLFVRGKKPTEEMIGLAREYSISILTTCDTMYIASGKLYANGLVPLTFSGK
jgi:predicted transcriptional regulator